MANAILKSFLGAAAGAALLTACMGADTQGPTARDEYGTVGVTVSTGVTASLSKAGLAKGADIKLSKVYVQLVSNAAAPDTVRDTISYGENGFKDTVSTVQQTLDTLKYNLKALRTWTVTVWTVDTKDSVVHIKTDSIVKLLAGEYRAKALTLAPRFVMYRAKFNFPDSISTAATSFKQKLNITRLKMYVNDSLVRDSSAAYPSATNIFLTYDYVPVNTSSTVKIEVIGNLGGWTLPGDSVLYKNDTIAVSAQAPTVDGSKTTTLPWVGPQTGSTGLAVTIQKLGLYEVTATTEDEVILKSGVKK